MDKLKTVQANSSLPLPQPTLSMVCVSIVSIVYNLRMDHYGARKYRNIENVISQHKYYFLTPMKSVLTTFQVKWSILADGLPIQLNPPQKPGSDPLTSGRRSQPPAVLRPSGTDKCQSHPNSRSPVNSPSILGRRRQWGARVSGRPIDGRRLSLPCIRQTFHNITTCRDCWVIIISRERLKLR